MKYGRMKQAVFLSRPNRFIANVLVDGKEEICHVKNTGRCKELLQPGVSIWIQKSDNPKRKTKYDLITVKKEDYLINMDSQIPNKVVEDWLHTSEAGKVIGNITFIKREVKYRNSRFDVYFEYEKGGICKKCFMEVKGVTLEEDGVVRFPDAPSLRAVKHLQELELACQEGYEAYVMFVIQMRPVKELRPNWDTHREFAEVLQQVSHHGVKVFAYECAVETDSIEMVSEVPVILAE
ncbi:MAG: DNA/RNA nuclease SfsA [Lachnospiraceae bacterium]|nr:DNA/RNA nuclease SfsA [Lachnospiraceae bacterium]MDD3617030.1 DNA/RNA nuclease SfsA [Lachnospiraceae bacterium]